MDCKGNKTVRHDKTNQQKNLKIKNNAILKILIRLTIKIVYFIRFALSLQSETQTC